MCKCSSCGKVINSKGEKGDKGDTGAAGTNGTNGAGVMENYFNGTPQLVYNGGAGITIDFGTSNADAQRIYYQGTIAVRAIAPANFTATPDGTATLPSETTNHTIPAIAGGIAFTYLTIPIAGDMLVDVSGTAFGIKLETAGAAEEVEFLSINVNFVRA